MDGKISRRGRFIAWSLAALVSVGAFVAQAVEATPAASGLIDRDFEVAVRKFVSKRFYNRIDASDEQRVKLDSIWTGTMEATRPQREAVRQKALELSALMASDDATDEQITDKAHELRAAREKVMDDRLKALLEARKVLTSEQRKKVGERIAQLINGGAMARRHGLLAD